MGRIELVSAKGEGAASAAFSGGVSCPVTTSVEQHDDDVIVR